MHTHRSLTRLVAAALLALASTPAFAVVERSNTGIGGALVVPYWTVNAGNDSLISIHNEGLRPVAVKVRTLGENGEIERVFSLYLDPMDTWVGAYTKIFTFGVELVDFINNDTSCYIDGFSTTTTTAEAATRGGKLSPPPPVPAFFGAMEIIAMGHPAVASDLLTDDGTWIDCDALVERFETGPWSSDAKAGLDAPTDAISASVSLIDVEGGGMQAIPGVALRGFSDVPLHSGPNDVQPDLLSAVDEGVDGTRSRVCIGGECTVHEWNLASEAVAAALSVSKLRGSFSVAEASNGQTELILYRPLKAYEMQPDGVEIEPLGQISLRDRRGRLITFAGPIITPPGGSPPYQAVQPFGAPAPVFQGFAFGAPPDLYLEEYDTPIVGHPITVRLTANFFANPDNPMDNRHLTGTFEVEYDALDAGATFLTAPDGTRYTGEPVLGVLIQQFTNGTLDFGEGPVLSNYRSSEPVRRSVRLEAPD